MEKLNRKMFYNIADMIELHPLMHDQAKYSDLNEREVLNDSQVIKCGSAQCVAGWAIAIEHGQLLIDLGKDKFIAGDSEFSAGEMDREAAGILGMDFDDAYTVFHSIPQESVYWPGLLRAIGDGTPLYDAVEANWVDDVNEFSLDIIGAELY